MHPLPGRMVGTRKPVPAANPRYADDENAVMRKACKLMVMGIDKMEKETMKQPFFTHFIGAAVEKVSFRYLVGLVHRCTDQSGGKMITDEVSAVLSLARFRCFSTVIFVAVLIR